MLQLGRFVTIMLRNILSWFSCFSVWLPSLVAKLTFYIIWKLPLETLLYFNAFINLTSMFYFHWIICQRKHEKNIKIIVTRITLADVMSSLYNSCNRVKKFLFKSKHFIVFSKIILNCKVQVALIIASFFICLQICLFT